MQFLTILCIILGLVSAGFAAPAPEFSLLVQPREHDLLNDSRQIIENLISNLRKAAQEAITAVGTFNDGVREEANHIREKIADDIDKLRQKVNDAVDNVWQKVQNTTAGVRECVDSRRNEAASIFNDTVGNTLTCADERISDVGEQIKGLAQMATDALEYANNAIADMQKCTEENHNLFTAGACMGRIVVQVETKSLMFTSHTAITFGRINLSIATLPAAMEVCAGTSILHAGIATGKVVIEIGGCTANSIFSSMMGSTTTQNPPTTETTSQNAPTTETASQNPPTSETTSQNPPTSETASQNPPTSETASQNPPTSETASQNPPTSETASQNPPTTETTSQNAPTTETTSLSPAVAETNPPAELPVTPVY